VRTVTLYTRPGCHLCDEARTALLDRRDSLPPFELDEVDIDGHDDLLRRYLERIPVFAVDGEVVSELELDLDQLRASLDTVRR
jgi:glutaredoxin